MHVEGFDSMDEAFGAMAAAEDSANSRLLPGQVALRDDVETHRYWAQPLPDMDLVVYGVTPPIAEIQTEAGFDVAENRARGYLTGTAFSAWEERGERGDTHVSQVVPISPLVFRMAEALGWPTWSMLRDPAHMPLAAALARSEQEARA